MPKTVNSVPLGPMGLFRLGYILARPRINPPGRFTA